MSQLSLVTTWLVFGTKIGKAIYLKDFVPYRSKQSKKIQKLEALLAAKDESGQQTTQPRVLETPETLTEEAAAPPQRGTVEMSEIGRFKSAACPCP